MGCTHADAQELRTPRPNEAVYREDCTQCFDSIDDDAGLNVCLYCFNGGCADDRDHASLHAQRFEHPLVLNIRRTRKKVQRDEPPQKISKLAIAAETEEDRYDTTTKVICYACQDDDVDATAGKLPVVIDGVLKATTFSRKEEVKAWEQEFIPCEHTLCLQQQSGKRIESQDLGQCSMCDLKENLWLCLECGNLGCGRAQFGGIGGNSHGLAHADATGHGVAVKLGSITPEGSADVYCYKCNEERVDPDLAKHLANWGIILAEQEKTEKSLMEMQIEHNLKWDFSMTTADGQELMPIFGPGFTGLKNLGNSCYLASIVQCLFALPDFQARYFRPDQDPPFTATPAEDLETQLRKLADGILSGRYSRPDTEVVSTPDTPETPHQKGLAPAMFKHLVGRGHEEFSTMRQQDAFEFLLHLLKIINVSNRSTQESDPVASFRFAMEQRLQCLSCRRVRYKVDEQDNISVPVPARKIATSGAEWSDEPPKPEYEAVTLKECLDIFTAEESVELTCPACGSKDGFSKRSLFKTLPKHLAVNARRFELVNWVPTKLNIPVEVGDAPFDMSVYLSPGQQEGEELLPDEPDASSSTAFVPNQAALDQLLTMGFPQVRCEKALHATGNNDPEAAMNWLFAHMEDPDIDDPVDLSGSSGAASTEEDPAKVAMLGDMGIDAARARKALRETGGDVNRAVDWVFSHPDDDGVMDDEPAAGNAGSKELPGSDSRPANFCLQSIVCHKGGSVHAGHYVAFIRKQLPDNSELSWVLFNDEKVVKAADVDEMKQFAYVYFFNRL